MIQFFCFYNKSAGKQARLACSKEFKHCNTIRFNGQDWVAFEFDGYGFQFDTVNAPSAASLIRGAKHIESLVALIVVEVEARQFVSWKPWMIRSCNEFARYQSGINVGLTLTPKHLYNKILKNKDANYSILYQWRR